MPPYFFSQDDPVIFVIGCPRPTAPVLFVVGLVCKGLRHRAGTVGKIFKGFYKADAFGQGLGSGYASAG